VKGKGEHVRGSMRDRKVGRPAHTFEGRGGGGEGGGGGGWRVAGAVNARVTWGEGEGGGGWQGNRRYSDSSIQ